ncbi:MAG: HDOD domain-containing protein [Mariprofundaceae bacterium]
MHTNPTEPLASFDIKLNENELLYQLKQPEDASKSRLTVYKKTIQTLPVPPALWHAFKKACDQDASNQKLGMIIKDDPVLSASILRIANSPGLGVRVEISDVGRAVMQLGSSMVRSIVSRYSFAAGSAQAGSIYDMKQLWKHGMAVSALAEIVADYIPNCDANEASTLGLFHDIGKMSLNLFPEYMLPAQLEAEQGHLVYEFKRFSCTHVDLGLLLAEHWELPDKVIQGIAYHHHPAFSEAEVIPEEIRAEVFAVYLADIMAIHLGFGTGDSGMVLPHESFNLMLKDTTLAELISHPKVISELSRIEKVEF